MRRQIGKFVNFKSLGARLTLGFGIIIILFSLLVWINLTSIYNNNNDVEEMIEHDLELLMISEELSIDMLQRTSYLQAYALTENAIYRDTFIDGTEESIALEELALEKSDSEQLEQAIERKVLWGHSTDELIELLNSGNEAEGIELFENRVMPNGMALASEFDDLANQYEDHINTLGNQIIVSGQSSLRISIILGSVTIILGIATAIITTKVISGPVNIITSRMLTIASGDLSEEIEETTRRDEIGQLHQATNQMTTNMRTLLLEIQNVSNTVTKHSDTLAQTTNDVSEGAEQISATMEELASGSETEANHASSLSTGMHNFVTTVSSAQELGESVENESENARGLSVNGVGLMEKSVNQMRAIDSIVTESVEKVVQLNEQSEQISNIVSVIQDISEQTNLLALNASIEAARAGEHGRGFAVVAEEVGKLAEQVGNSIQEVTEIVTGIQGNSSIVKVSLEDSYKQVQQGMGTIENTSETFRQIDDTIGHVTDHIQKMTSQLTNMLSTSQTLSGSIEEIASISEESAAGIEETSASSEEVSSSMTEILTSSADLTKLGSELNDLLGQFKL